MVGEDRGMMSVKALRRVHVIRQAMEKQRTQVKAGARVGLTARHVRRLIERVQQEGDQGRAPGDGGGTFSAPEAAAAGADAPRGGVAPAGWLAPRLGRGPGAPVGADGIQR